MNKLQFKQFIEQVDFPAMQYVVFGGASLTIRGLRDCNDVDFFVSDRLYAGLRQNQWAETSTNKRKPYLVNNIGGVAAQAFNIWEGGRWLPDISRYITAPELIDGIPFMPLDELYEWKKATGRAKDLADLVIIEQFWAKK